MKLTFKTTKLVAFGKEIIFERTNFFLKENNYNIVTASNSRILFDNKINGWKLVSNSLFFIRMNEGDFEFIEKDLGTKIILTFNVSILIELLQLMILVFASTYMGYKVLFLAIILVIIFFFKVQITRRNIIGNIMSM